MKLNLHGKFAHPRAKLFGLALAIVLLAGVFAPLYQVRASPGLWWDSAWTYRKQIIIDHTKITADLIDFPVLINITDPGLAAHAKSNGYDIAFTANDTTKLSHQIESFNSATGRLAGWVKIPSLSSTVDTVLYMYYGNPSASDQQNKNGVWDSHYKMVQHLNEASGTQHDSTANGKDATPNGGVSQGIAGRIDGADSFTGGSPATQWLTVGSISASDWTISFWANSRSTSQAAIYPIGLGSGAGNPGKAGIGMGGTYQSETHYFYVYNGTDTANGLVWGGPLVQINTWYYVVVTLSGTSCTIYVNGTSRATGTLQNIAITNLYIGARSDGHILGFNGVIDEARVSDMSRSSALISTEFNNQKAPSTFYNVGSEETATPTPPRVSNPSPANETTEVPTSLSKLSFNLTDPQNDLMNYQVTTSPNIGSGSGAGVGNGNYDVPVSGLQVNTAYTWRVCVTDPAGSGLWNNVTFHFTTMGVLGAYWLNGWTYRKNHTMASAEGAGTNYQTMVKVEYSTSTPSSWLDTLPTNIPVFLTTDVSSNGTVFAGGNNYDIYKSTDSGITFTQIFTIPTQSNPWGLMAGRVWTTFVDSRDYVFVSAGATNRLYRSTNYGTSFTEVLNFPGRTTYADGHVIAMTEDADHNLYAAEYADTPPAGGSRLWKSTDSGATWSPVSKTWSARHLHAVKWNPYNGWLYVLTGEASDGSQTEYQQAWRSKDGGNTWACVVGWGSDIYATKYLSIEFINNDVYLGQDHQGGTESDLIQKITDDGGDHYTPVTVYNNPYPAAIMTSATKLNDTILFSTCSESYDPATCQVVMSKDGITWTVLIAQVVSTTNRYINRLTVHPRNGLIYGCINPNYAYYVASPSTPRPPSFQPRPYTVFAEGHCKTDFGDIRFTDNDGRTLLDYWMESKTDGDNAIFWVKVADDLSQFNRTIYVYYGKSDATTTSNPDNTFLFFDDFNGDLSKWMTISGSWVTQGGNLTIEPTVGNNYLIVKNAFAASNIAIRTRIMSTQAGDIQAHPGIIWHANNFTSTSQRNDQVYFRPHDTSPSSTTGNIQPAYFDGSPVVNMHDAKKGSYFNWNTWYTLEVRFPPDGNVTLYNNNLYWHNWGNQLYSCDHIGVLAHENGKDYFDYFAVRKFVPVEPAHGSWGPEETRGPTSIIVYPTNTNAAFGTDCTVYINVTAIQDFYAWEFQLKYDQTVLDLTSCSPVSGGLNEPTQAFYNLVNETDGHLWWAISTVHPPTTGISYSRHAIFELHFHTIALGTANLNLYGTVLSNSTGMALPHMVVNGTVTVNDFIDLTITGINIINHGCSLYKNDTYGNGAPYYYPVEVTISNLGSLTAGAFYVKLEAYWIDGSVSESLMEMSVANLAAGNSLIVNFTSLFHPMQTGYYRLTATADSRNNIEEPYETNNALTLGNVRVTVMGDLNGDGVVNIIDGTLMALAWQGTPGSIQWNIKADINHDGVVDIVDGTRIGLHWGETR